MSDERAYRYRHTQWLPGLAVRAGAALHRTCGPRSDGERGDVQTDRKRHRAPEVVGGVAEHHALIAGLCRNVLRGWRRSPDRQSDGAPWLQFERLLPVMATHNAAESASRPTSEECSRCWHPGFRGRRATSQYPLDVTSPGREHAGGAEVSGPWLDANLNSKSSRMASGEFDL